VKNDVQSTQLELSVPNPSTHAVSVCWAGARQVVKSQHEGEGHVVESQEQMPPPGGGTSPPPAMRPSSHFWPGTHSGPPPQLQVRMTQSSARPASRQSRQGLPPLPQAPI
jgi:hypothetical protein